MGQIEVMEGFAGRDKRFRFVAGKEALGEKAKTVEWGNGFWEWFLEMLACSGMNE